MSNDSIIHQTRHDVKDENKFSEMVPASGLEPLTTTMSR